MALAVTHVIVAIVLFDLFRHYISSVHKFPRYLVLVGGIAGLAPDLDIPLGWLISSFTPMPTNIHGAFTHSIFFVLAIALAGFITHFWNRKWARILYVIAVGWFIHICLDCLFNPYPTFLWPLGFDTKAMCPSFSILKNYRTGIDAIILIAWLVHEEVHKKIKDYI